MPLLKPQDLKPEMVLASDVSNLDGRVLFKKGVVLQERQVEILKMWGIPQVEIEGDEPEEDPLQLESYPQAVIEKAEEILSEKFILTKSTHPAVAVIKKICVSNLARTLSGGISK